MRSINRLNKKCNLAQQLGAIGILAGMISSFSPLGCASSIETAPLRYRDRHQNNGHLLPAITVERLQACLEEYGGQLDDDSLRVEATVQVDQAGQTRNVGVTGIPENAPDFAACARIALREMTVPALPLRAGSTIGAANMEASATGNEIAHPGVLVEVAILLGEFMAQHGAKAVLYAVTIEVVGTVAVVATQEMITRTRWRKRCTDGYVNCIASPAGRARGNNWNERRCGTCRNVCDKNKGSWPSHIEMFPEGTVSCY